MSDELVFTTRIPAVAPKRPCLAPAAPAKRRCLGAARPGSATKASAPAAATTPQKAEKKSPETEQRSLAALVAKWQQKLPRRPGSKESWLDVRISLRRSLPWMQRMRQAGAMSWQLRSLVLRTAGQQGQVGESHKARGRGTPPRRRGS